MSASYEEPWRPANYRAVLLRADGSVVFTSNLNAADDDEALGFAQAMVDGHAVELWDGLRFIEHFPSID
ncbi:MULTISPECIES: hypothetical protein [Methylobacterium]|uniref:Uncharacterized protein n=1 Tax=Methylobacterium thuringiense TaxID=1003091 RepID=A0ABQ4TJX2_9HYPH|nr:MULTISPECIES: hypothetical protein [Methylobacterium]TXN21782.1 hypothetical protein FV217_13310 [Methylobacterium sp. WL9]GJE54812.1 hypothetical protein EKPJFOCH_1297 [Methylobacterium thuringiense]